MEHVAECIICIAITSATRKESANISRGAVIIQRSELGCNTDDPCTGAICVGLREMRSSKVVVDYIAYLALKADSNGLSLACKNLMRSNWCSC